MNERALIETGVQQMQGGELDAAEKTFQDALVISPKNADALHLLGLTRNLKGNSSEAIDPIRDAISLSPANPFFQNSLGQVYQALGDHGEALDCFSQATEINPEFPEAHFGMAVAEQKLGRPEDALASYRQALALKPDFPQALCNIGNVLKELGNLEEAVTRFNQFIASAPQLVQAETHVNLGDALRDLGRLEEAVQCYESALNKKPEFAEAYVNLGIARTDLGQWDAANASFAKAHDLDPEMCEPFIGFGNVLRKLDQLDEALVHYRKAVALDPGHAGAHDNLGRALRRQGQLEDAIDCFRESLRLDPSSHKVHFNLSNALLLLGRLSEGWAEYGWRWQNDSDERRAFPQPLWQGGDVNDKTILVWAEQGVGEEVRFASMVPDLIDAGARVVLEADPRLVPLFERSFPGLSCIAKEIPPSDEACRQDIDFQVPCGDLGKWFRGDLNSFPERGGYLVADEVRRDQMRQRYLDGTTDLLVGISWNSKNKRIGDRKSLALSELEPLAGVAGVKLVDLQYGDTQAQRDAFHTETGIEILHDDGIDQMADLDAFAAQVAAMDLVISVSNTTVHMAGALGIPTWVILNTAPLACWVVGRNDSPWYSSLKLFRQSKPGLWSDVIERVAKELSSMDGADGGH